MDFFNWGGAHGEKVSSYLWVYVVITVFFTSITLGLWYYFVIYRQSASKLVDEERLVEGAAKVSREEKLQPVRTKLNNLGKCFGG